MVIKTLIRMPQEVYEKLVAEAKKEERSINGMMVYILKKYLEK